MSRDGKGGCAEETSDHGTRYTFSSAIIIIDMQGGVVRSVMVDQMGDVAEHGSDRASLSLPVGRVSKLFPLDSVFLRGERERDEGCREELDRTVPYNGGKMLCSNLKFNIVETERMFCVTSGVSIFARSKKEVEGHPYAVHGGLVSD